MNDLIWVWIILLTIITLLNAFELSKIPEGEWQCTEWKERIVGYRCFDEEGLWYWCMKGIGEKVVEKECIREVWTRMPIQEDVKP